MFKNNLNILTCFIFVLFFITASITSAQNSVPPKWYVGAFGGYVSGELNSNDPSHKESTGDYDDDSPMAGIFIGYQHHFENNWFAGAELIVPVYMEKGTAVDKLYFPDLVTYEASFKYALMLAGKWGYNFGNALPYVFGTVGFVNVDGKTYNVDLDENYSPGFVQSAAATHFVWQLGGGLDYNFSEVLFAGARVAAFIGAKADHTMPWNEPGPNLFGYDALLIQINIGYRFNF